MTRPTSRLVGVVVVLVVTLVISTNSGNKRESRVVQNAVSVNLSWTPKQCFLPSLLPSTDRLFEICTTEPERVECTMNPKCFQWRSGAWNVNISEDDLQSTFQELATRPVTCQRLLDNMRDITGEDFVFDGRKLSSRAADCLLKYYTPFEAMSILHHLARGRAIMLLGDSGMRHVFLRLVAYLRGDQQVIFNHYFHNTAVYKVLPTIDRLSVGEHILPKMIFVPERTTDTLLELFFFWCPLMSERENLENICQPFHALDRTSVFVPSNFYWHAGHRGVNTTRELVEWTEGLLKATKLHLVLLFTSPMIGGPSEVSNERSELLRNFAVRSATRRRTSLVVDYKGIVDVAVAAGPIGHDDHHFMCQAKDYFPMPIVSLTSNSTIGCYDGVDLALWQVTFHQLMPHLQSRL